jgi:murein DD-endopeptidase MepM/ murein hydrolase activator NlpD
VLLVALSSRHRRAAAGPASEPPMRREPFVVRGGETMSELLERARLAQGRSADVVAALRAAGFNLRGLRPGDSLIALYRNSTLARLLYTRSLEQVYRVDLDSAVPRVSMLLRAVSLSPAAVVGIISNSLYETIIRLDESPDLANRFADLFGWEMDFFTEVQNGDSFAVLFERKTVESIPAGMGDLLAARYSGAAGTFDAFRFILPDGRLEYFTADGRSLRKQFLRSPLRFSRISSFFGSRRHPILRVRRQHHGLDYVAPRGTPVSAAADGYVVNAGWSGGYGRLIEVAHANGYTTRYGHLSGFARGVKHGTAVRQGDLIGYVGTSGLSTGSHLHYEVRRQGSSLNPLRLDPPRDPPVPPVLAHAFARTRDSLARLLDRLCQEPATARP